MRRLGCSKTQLLGSSPRSTSLPIPLVASLIATNFVCFFSPLTDSAFGQQVWITDAIFGLGKVDIQSGAVSMVGQTSVPLYDIAFDKNGDLWGVYTYAPEGAELYRVDTSTAKLTFVGELGSGEGVNGLTFGPDGTLYGSGFSGMLFSISTQTGKATALGSMGSPSAGDLAFLGDQLYLSSGIEQTNSQLVRVSLQPVSGTLVGSMGVADTWGLAAVGGELLGAAGTTLYGIDVNTGSASPIVNFGGKGLEKVWGMAAPIPTPPSLVGVGFLTLWASVRRQRKLVR